MRQRFPDGRCGREYKRSTTTSKPSELSALQTAQPSPKFGSYQQRARSPYCVVDEAGQIQLEHRVATSAKALREVFVAMPRSRIALETGTHSPWISRLLSELGREVMVAHARKVWLIGESEERRSSRCADAGAAGPD